MFDLQFLSPDAVGPRGQIRFGNLDEIFRSDLSYWSEKDYRKQWHDALRRLLGSDHITSCLATSITEPANANFFVVWPLLRDNEAVYLQNRLLFLDQLPNPTSLTALWEQLGPWERISEDGDRISEWVTDIASVKAYLAS